MLHNDLLGVKAVNDTQARQIASKADKAEVDQLKADNDSKAQENVTKKPGSINST